MQNEGRLKYHRIPFSEKNFSEYFNTEMSTNHSVKSLFVLVQYLNTHKRLTECGDVFLINKVNHASELCGSWVTPYCGQKLRIAT